MSKKGWYYEVFVMGRWRPRWSIEKPMMKDGKLYTYGGGSGPRVRGLVAIQHFKDAMSLDQLREWYGPDGKFRAVTNDIPREN